MDSNIYVTLTASGLKQSGKMTYDTSFSYGDGYLSFIDGAVFEKVSAGETAMSYTLSAGGETLITGVLTITVPGSGSIQYETDYTTAITFDEDDFDAFWDTYAAGGYLDYVVFDGQPDYGTLYTDSTLKTKVSKQMLFEYGYANSSMFYDLDTVRYVPLASKITTYEDTVDFVAYGSTGEVLPGTVYITLNDNGYVTISSLGVAFGNSSVDLDDSIAEEFKEAKGLDLDHVIFDLPAVEDGVLFYDFETSLGSYRIKKTDEFHVAPGNQEMSLAKVCFVPAAGKTGMVRVYYTAYAANGTSYDSYVIMNVAAKNKSVRFTDVNAKSYSWAADSVDFLYYQEVVGGTNSAGTLYSPKNNITRGHFMLMLYRAFLEADYEGYDVKSNFSDVNKGTTSTSKELYQAVGVAKALGIAKGSNNKYNPNAYITREEAMTLIYRTLDLLKLDLSYSGSKTMNSFSDSAKVASYATGAMDYLIDHGVVVGSNGKINPKSNITRAEMAVTLHRVLTY